MAWIHIAAGIYLVGNFAYHRWVEDWLFPPEVKPQPLKELQLPRTDEGAVIPLIYGKCRVRSPVLVWVGEISEEAGSVGNGSPNAAVIYRASVLFIVGIPFGHGTTTVNFHGMWAGEKKFDWAPAGANQYLVELEEYGDNGFVGQSLWVMDGSSSQELVDDSGVAQNIVGTRMLASGLTKDDIPGYRGYLSMFLYNNIGGFYFGASPNVPAYNFEVSSYDTTSGALNAWASVGQDANPINVLYDLLTAKFGKANVDYIDMTTFSSAAYKLHTESNGYSRAIESATEFDNHIMEILFQIDAALYEDPADGKLKIKLIRNDYDPATIPHITKANCKDIVNFAVSGWADVPNKLKLVFTNRDDEYRDGSASYQNLANVAMQDGQVIEKVIRMPGVMNQALANRLVAREGAALCRPNIKCRAWVDRSFIDVTQGDAVKLTWDEPDIPGLVFRVANVDRGLLNDNKIGLDLLLDYYYVWRNIPFTPTVPGLGEDLPLDFGT